MFTDLDRFQDTCLSQGLHQSGPYKCPDFPPSLSLVLMIEVKKIERVDNTNNPNPLSLKSIKHSFDKIYLLLKFTVIIYNVIK